MALGRASKEMLSGIDGAVSVLSHTPEVLRIHSLISNSSPRVDGKDGPGDELPAPLLCSNVPPELKQDGMASQQRARSANKLGRRHNVK